MRLVPRLTVIVIPASLRVGSYANRDSWEHEAFVARMRDEPDFRERELSVLALRYGTAQFSYVQTLALVTRNAFRQGLAALGLRPMAVRRFLQHGRKGGVLNHVRRQRGLPPIDWRETRP
jgi:hypothetical protein